MDEGYFMGHGECVKETADALCVAVDGEEIWFPKSQIHDFSEVTEEGDEGDFVITVWLARQRGYL